MKGESVLINGERWTVVDVAPAAPLADMVAALLEDEGIVAMTRGANLTSDILTHLGTQSVGTAYVLVPEPQSERALSLIAETVTDYQGDDLDALLEALAAEGPEEAPDD